MTTLFGTAPRHVYVTSGGNVFCFDAHNRLIPELCGLWDRLESRVRERADALTEWH
jgi:hypothetical protein